MMKNWVFFLFCFLLFSATGANADKNFQNFDKSAFYEVLKNGDVGEIDTQIALVEASPIKEKGAYDGVLLMKKAGLVKKPKDKLGFFKEGRIKFQTAFNAETANVEYHFLRLIIQEHAPKIVKYSGQIEEDGQYIKDHFKSLEPTLQKAVVDYSKNSKILHPTDF